MVGNHLKKCYSGMIQGHVCYDSDGLESDYAVHEHNAQQNRGLHLCVEILQDLVLPFRLIGNCLSV